MNYLLFLERRRFSVILLLLMTWHGHAALALETTCPVADKSDTVQFAVNAVGNCGLPTALHNAGVDVARDHVFIGATQSPRTMDAESDDSQARSEATLLRLAHLRQTKPGQLPEQLQFGRRFVVSIAADGLPLASYPIQNGSNPFRGHSRELGVTLEARASLLPSLYVAADLALSFGEFRSALPAGHRILLAPALELSGGLLTELPAGIEIGLMGYCVSNASEEDPTGGHAAESLAFDLSLAHRFDRLEISVSMINFLELVLSEGSDIRETNSEIAIAHLARQSDESIHSRSLLLEIDVNF